ncbi:MAG: hypothetical protein ABI811_19205 [Acidobacteriota bacterium]
MPAPRIRVFHWKAEEAQPLLETLRNGGYAVDYPGDKVAGNFQSMRSKPPAAVVIDLTRMPSHGRQAAAGIRYTKTLRHLPIVFVDGETDKVERIRTEMPDATFTTRAKLIGVLKRVKPLASPVQPTRMMDSYSGRTVAQKLGIKEHLRVAVFDPPASYEKVIGVLPDGASFEEEPVDLPPLMLWFVRESESFLAELPAMRARTAKSRLWIIYPKLQPKEKKNTGSGINQNFIRESALAVGLVDYKICSVNEIWSGMLFTRKK